MRTNFTLLSAVLALANIESVAAQACNADNALRAIRKYTVGSVAQTFCASLLRATVTVGVTETSLTTTTTATTLPDAFETGYATVTSIVVNTLPGTSTIYLTEANPTSTATEETTTATTTTASVHLIPRRVKARGITEDAAKIDPTRLASACSCILSGVTPTSTVTSTATTVSFGTVVDTSAPTSTLTSTSTSTTVTETSTTETITTTTTTAPPTSTETATVTVTATSVSIVTETYYCGKKGAAAPAFLGGGNTISVTPKAQPACKISCKNNADCKSYIWLAGSCTLLKQYLTPANFQFQGLELANGWSKVCPN